MRNFLFGLLFIGNFLINAQGLRQPKFYLNGDLVSQERISLIAPKNIKEIKIERETEQGEVYIITNKILFFNYADLKRRVKVGVDVNPEILIDNEKYLAKNDILIDRSIIRKISLIKNISNDMGVIFIKTIDYRRKLEEERNPPVRIRGEQSPITLRF